MPFAVDFAFVVFGSRIGPAEYLIIGQLLSPPVLWVLFPTLPALYVAIYYDLKRRHGDR